MPNTTRFKKYILYNLPIIHSTLAILNFTRTLEIIIDFLAVSVVLADIYGMATCRQGIDGIGIRLCKKEISIYVCEKSTKFGVDSLTEKNCCAI